MNPHRLQPRALAARTILSLLTATALPVLAQTAPQTPPPQRFVLEGAVIDSRNAQNLGVTSESGEIAALFRAQKTLTFGILRSAGIDLDTLAPEVRARIERFQTTNVDAFRAFSNGLDLKDQGRFAEAREQFRRAAELDPGFALAVEQQQAMPEITLGTQVQIRAVVAAAAGQAVDRGKATYVIDAARAVAAIQAGQTVVQVAAAAPTDAAALSAGDRSRDYTSNPAGSGTDYVPNLATGLAFTVTAAGQQGRGYAFNNEWKADQYRVGETGALESAGSAVGLQAQRESATQQVLGSSTLADGTVAYWGRWLSTPDASASVTVGGQTHRSPALGAVDWIAGDATRSMPTSGTAVFTPAGGGNLSDVSGSVAVNFVTRGVAVQNLGFTIDGLVFSGLNGDAVYDSRTLSGAFNGNYSSGQCSGCNEFLPGSSIFGGNFLGGNADGLIFSTTVIDRSGAIRGGTTLMKRP
ncbi:MAG: hypothetical protein H6933_08260 [Burkholderiaceae bacterium]|nr:hypothetical protein [Rhodoferax sp.]MCP5284877.1 hypothetical protein [Burkholderiaceae bacterium]